MPTPKRQHGAPALLLASPLHVALQGMVPGLNVMVVLVFGAGGWVGGKVGGGDAIRQLAANPRLEAFPVTRIHALESTLVLHGVYPF